LIVIRLATEDDIPWILHIEQEAISPPWTHGALLGEIYRDDSYFIVACQNVGTQDMGTQDRERQERGAAPVLGFAILRQVGDDGELLQIAVDRDARRSGVGDLLIADAIGYADKNVFNSIFLEVRRSNEAAIGLYKKQGFKTLRIRKDYYERPVEDALIMVKALAR